MCGHRSIFGRHCSMCYAHGISSFSDRVSPECFSSAIRSTLGQTTSRQNTQSSIDLVFSMVLFLATDALFHSFPEG